MAELRRSSCHCGAVELEIRFDRGLENLRRCDCSLCRRKGAIMASVPLDAVRVIKGESELACYRWNTMVAEHYFCRTCGIYTHHRRRSDPTQYGINIACVEGVDPFAYGEVPIGGGSRDAPLPPPA